MFDASAPRFVLAALLMGSIFGAVGCFRDAGGDQPFGFIDELVADNPEAVVLLVLENLTGHDLSIGFEIDGDPDGALVFNGESLVIEFDCFKTVALVFEDRFDPQTGLFIEGFDLLDAQASRPTDFSCGEAVIFTLEESEILISTEPVREAS